MYSVYEAYGGGAEGGAIAGLGWVSVAEGLGCLRFGGMLR